MPRTLSAAEQKARKERSAAAKKGISEAKKKRTSDHEEADATNSQADQSVATIVALGLMI